jgi:hypothetical protein
LWHHTHTNNIADCTIAISSARIAAVAAELRFERFFMRLRLLLVPGLLLLLFLAACSPAPTLRDDRFLKDTSLLTDDPCAAPCWRGITPGETAWRDMTIIIDDAADLNGIEDIPVPDSQAKVRTFAATEGVPCCRIDSSLDGKTVELVWYQLAPGQISLGQVIEKYGEPSFAAADDITPDQALVSVAFPDVPMILFVFAPGIATGELTPASEVVGALYVSSSLMQEIQNDTNWFTWRGYQTLQGWFDSTPDRTPEGTAEATAEATQEAQ